MSLKYLLDENLDPIYKRQLIESNPNLVVWKIGEPNSPPLSTLDPEILCWCEEHNFVLVTNNRKSMPVHLAEHIERGGHVPGIFILGTKISIGENINQLIFIAESSFEDEYQDRSSIYQKFDTALKLGWLIIPEEEIILVVFPGQRLELYQDATQLPILKEIELELTVETVFSWLSFS